MSHLNGYCVKISEIFRNKMLFSGFGVKSSPDGDTLSLPLYLCSPTTGKEGDEREREDKIIDEDSPPHGSFQGIVSRQRG